MPFCNRGEGGLGVGDLDEVVRGGAGCERLDGERRGGFLDLNGIDWGRRKVKLWGGGWLRGCRGSRGRVIRVC